VYELQKFSCKIEFFLITSLFFIGLTGVFRIFSQDDRDFDTYPSGPDWYHLHYSSYRCH